MPDTLEAEQYREAVEDCRRGKPRLFMERYLKIRYANGTLGTLVFTPEQDQYYRESFLNLKDYYTPMVMLTLKHRDARSTTFVAAAAFAFQCCVAGFVCAFITDSEDKLKQVILPMFDIFDSNLPSYAKQEHGKWDTELREYIFKGTDGSAMPASVTFSSARSKNFLRGGRPKMVILSEESSFDDALSRDLLVGLEGSLTETSWEWHEATPRGKGNSFYTKWKAIKEELSPGSVIFRRWFDRKDFSYSSDSPLVRPVDRQECDATGTLVLTPEEMVLTTLFNADGTPVLGRIFWRRTHVQNAINASFGDEDRGLSAFLQEYPEDELGCWYNLSNPSLPQNRIQRLTNLCRPPIESPPPSQGVKWQLWEHYNSGHSYVAGLDPAEDIERGDLMAFQVIDASTGHHVLQLWGKTGASLFTRICEEVSREYVGLLWVIERQYGGAFIAEAKRLGVRLYRAPTGRQAAFTEGGAPSFQPYGFHTNVATKPLMHDAVWEGLYNGGLETKSELLVNDMTDYNPQHDHTPDRLSAFMLAAVVIREMGPGRTAVGRGKGTPRMVTTVPYG